jgi:hypothetical protein
MIAAAIIRRLLRWREDLKTEAMPMTSDKRLSWAAELFTLPTLSGGLLDCCAIASLYSLSAVE